MTESSLILSEDVVQQFRLAGISTPEIEPESYEFWAKPLTIVQEPNDPHAVPFDPPAMPFDPPAVPFDPHAGPFQPYAAPFEPYTAPFDPHGWQPTAFARGFVSQFVRYGGYNPYDIRASTEERSSRERLRQEIESLKQVNEQLQRKLELLRQEIEILRQETSSPERCALRKEVFDTTTHDEVLDILSRNGLKECAQDYDDYLTWRKEDLEEDESPEIILQSLQSWAWFLLDYVEPSNLPYAKLSADFVGCVELTWTLSPKSIPDSLENKYYGNGEGILLLSFYPSYLNYLSILTGPYGSEKRRIALSGYIPHTKTKEIMDLFRRRIVDDTN